MSHRSIVTAFLFAALAFSSALSLPLAAQDATPDATSARTQYFPATKDGIHLEMVFNYNLSNPDAEEGVVDMVWGSNYATEPSGVYNTAYIPDAVDNFTHSVAWYREHHPEWLEYKCDQKTLAFEFGAKNLAPLNFASPEVRAYQWALWVDAPLAQGFGGIAVDTMDLTNDWARCGHFDASGTWVQQYTGKSEDPAFRDDVLAWEAATYEHTHNYSETATMQVNVSFQFGQPLEANRRLMTTTDLLFDERGFTNWGAAGQNVTTPEEWSVIVSALQYVQSKGICYMTNGEEPQPTAEISQKERLWVLANYLLVKNDCTYVYITGITDGQQDYGSLVVFPMYSVPIGHATEPMTKTQGVWQRIYSGGLTLVNPYIETATVTLPPGCYVDVNGNAVSSPVTMKRQTGLILLLKQ
jgi:hypothetical protein